MRTLLLFLFVVLLSLGWPSRVWATPPQPPDCHDETPAYLATITDPADVLEYFHSWQVQSVRVCKSGDTDVEAILQYVPPATYSSAGLKYHATVRLALQNNAISNSEQLQQLYGNYRTHIAAFENDPNIKRFIQITGFTDVDNSEVGKFQINPTGRDRLTFSIAANTVTAFIFVDPRLIKNLAAFVPIVQRIPQVAEFDQHYPIGYARFDGTRFYLYKESECPDCGDYIIFDLSQATPRVGSYRLSNKYGWETLPEIAQAHRIAEKNLLQGELSNCVIGRGDMHAYTAVNDYRGINPPDRQITVALNCDDGSHWKDVALVLHPDGTYDHLRVEFDNQAAPAPSPGSNARCTLIPFGLVAASVYVWRKRKSA